MTAEVGVLNTLGVALAADSAVSLGRSAGKIYTSADKLFQLSHHAPVGVMIYDHAQFLGIPWETVIKAYREQLGETRFPKLKDYEEHLVEFIQTERRLFTDVAQMGFVAEFAGSVFKTLLDELNESFPQNEDAADVTADEIRAKFAAIVKSHLEAVRGDPRIETLPDELPARIRKQYKPVIAEQKKNVLKSLPLTAGASRNLSTLVIECLVREGHVSSTTGVIVAGFGEDEYFPSLRELTFHGMASNQPLFYARDPICVGGNAGRAAVAAFAQREMVSMFMNGINPDLRAFLTQSSIELVGGIADVILNDVKEHDPDYGKELEKRVARRITESLRGFVNGVNRRVAVKHSSPVLAIVGALPKEELGAIAESLVNLTKFKRRVSTQRETVGGPIDVAIITKGDGFVWVRRKHYFDIDLNPRYEARHYRRMDK